MRYVREFDDWVQHWHQVAFDWIEYKYETTSNRVMLLFATAGQFLFGANDVLVDKEPPIMSSFFILWFVFLFVTDKKTKSIENNALIVWMRDFWLIKASKVLIWVALIGLTVTMSSLYNIFGMACGLSSIYFLLCLDDVDGKKRREFERREAELYAERQLI